MPGTDLLLIDGGEKARRRGPRGKDVTPAQIETFLITLGAGHAGAIAGYAAGGWRFVAPVAGMRALDKISGQTATYDGAAWVVGTVKGAKLELAGTQVVGARLAAVADPTGGASVDAEARAAIVAILDRLRSHGLIAP